MPSGQAIASTTGLSSAAVDVASSLLFALPINLGSMALLMFVGHGHSAPPRAPATPVRAQAPAVDIRPEEHGRLFFAEALQLKPRARVGLPTVERSYLAWCMRQGIEPLPNEVIGAQLVAVMEQNGIVGRVDSKGQPKLLGVTVRTAGVAA